MSGSCKKAGRNKKSASNTNYIAGKRWEINASKRQAAHKRFVEDKQNINKGAKRRARRADWLAHTANGADGKPITSFVDYERSKEERKKEKAAYQPKTALRAALTEQL